MNKRKSGAFDRPWQLRSKHQALAQGMGHRVGKHVLTSSDVLEKSTYYILDASGNTMAVYDRVIDEVEESVDYYQAEKHIYGSSRLGILNSHIKMLGTATDVIPKVIIHNIGKRNYELSNHLGNVLSVISDKPVPNDDDTDGTNDWYWSDIRVAQDYSPFGVTLDGRNFTVDEKYRYSFQDMEHDDELKGDGNSYDFGARLLDPRLGRWLTIDSQFKKQPSQSPYKSFFNNPNYWLDPKGNTEYEIVVLKDERSGKSITLHVTKSCKVKTDGVVHYDEGSLLPYQNYYDYASKHTTITFHKDGTVSMEDTKKLMKNKGIKYTDFVPMDEIFGNTAKPGSIYDPKDPFIQGGGFYMTGSRGEGSKYYSKDPDYVGDVDDLIGGITGRTQGGFISKKASISVEEILESLKYIAETPEKIEPLVELFKEVYEGLSPKEDKSVIQPNHRPLSNKETVINSSGGTERLPASNQEIRCGDTVNGNPNVVIPMKKK